ncbi:MAG: tetratricopeptide repeat protein, partial [Burkholderiales bacterium]|nr:tetratricopeptide repeat protein [Anaerolineae bacterium]
VRSDQPQGSAWLIGGESGVGKSRLLDELRTLALVDGALVLRGQAVTEGGLPYQVWRDPMRRLVISTPMTALEASILKEIVPDISDLLGYDVPNAVALEGAQQQQRLIYTILNMFRKQSHLVVVLLDDLQWALESIEVLREMTSIVGPLPLLIVGSYRDDERPELPQTLSNVNMHVLKLERLDMRGITSLSVSMLGEAGRLPEVLDLLQRETEGNVFFLVEVVRALAEEAGGLNEVGRITLPERVFTGGVQQIVRRRLSRVPEHAYLLLKLTAVIGRQLDLDLLRLIVPDVSLERWLIDCSNVAVLDVYEGRWRFAHDKLREAMLTDLSDDERPTLHRQAAEALEALYPDDSTRALALAEHWRSAGEPTKERTYALLAAEQLQAVSAYSDAAALLERVITLLTEADSETSHQAAQTQRLLGYNYRRMGDYANALRWYASSLSIARQLDDRSSMAANLIEIGNTTWQQGDYVNATIHLNEALALAEAADDLASQALALNQLGYVCYWTGDLDAGWRHQQQALAIYTTLGDVRGMGIAANSLGMVAELKGDFDAARIYFEQGLARARQVGYVRGISGGLNNIGNAFYLAGDYINARRYLLESLEIDERVGARWDRANSLCNLAFITLKLEDYPQARQELCEGIHIAYNIGAPAIIVEMLAGFAALYFQAGQAERAVELVSYITFHPSVSEWVLRMRVDPLRVQLTEALDASTFDAAWERGQALDFDALIAELIASS